MIGSDKILSNLIKNKRIFSMILYGPPGIGKTTIAVNLASELAKITGDKVETSVTGEDKEKIYLNFIGKELCLKKLK